jgi:3-deoxy-manno-octulosonate cytidylyltransferase (CMP-KDO synthetase)
MSEFVVVIPVRMESSRLPGKPLAEIGGKPMVSWVVAQARRSSAGEVVVATDSERIADACATDGIDVAMTSASHASGTDRIAEVARSRGWPSERIVVNVQGDEPLLPPVLIDQVALLLEQDAGADIATLQTPFADATQYRSTHTAKVIADRRGNALYFSRAAIPHDAADGAPAIARRHVGIYAYRCQSLLELAAAAPCELERQERLEQLRALWLGQRIVVADACAVPAHGVDTPGDLEKIRTVAGRHPDEEHAPND